jgi:FKBP-type peptidyl-prolyl cis-trans isomerase FklB
LVQDGQIREGVRVESRQILPFTPHPATASDFLVGLQSGWTNVTIKSMQKPFTTVTILWATGVLLLMPAVAQQTPTANPQTPSSAKTQSAPVAKTRRAPAAKSPPLTLKTQKEKFSYALGMNIGANLHRQDVPVDPSILTRGLRDALAGGKTALTEDEAKIVLTEVQNDMRKKQQEKMQAAGAVNKKEGDEFLAANKTKAGVTTLPSGLQYKILQPGTGPKPAASDTVVCNYRGTLIKGTEFDSSYKRGQPATFPVSGVIKGWTEALQLMPVGSKWQLFLPADLAYGDRGAGADIGPGATLIFEVELLSIQAKNDKNQDKNPGKNQDKNPDKGPDKQ